MDYREGQEYREAVWFGFDKAWAKARRSRLISRMRRQSDDLLTIDQLRACVKVEGGSYAGCKTIPIDRIIGSEDRSEDFNRNFMPRKNFMRVRWCSIAAAYSQGKALPPIKVLELGGVYFIRDGNHRVSVARTQKVAYIEAEIIRIDSEAELDSTKRLAIA